MSKRNIVIIAAVAVAAVVLGVVLIAMPKKTVSPAGVSVGSSSTSTGATTTTPPAGANAGTTTGASDSTSGGGSAPVTNNNNSSSTTGSKSKNPVVSRAKDTRFDFTFGTFKTITLPSDTSTLKEPAAAGQALGKLVANPSSAVAGVALGKAMRMSGYKVTVRPVGYGPDLKVANTASVIANRVLVHVDKAEPYGIAPKDKFLTGNDVLAVIDVAQDGNITKGGTYSASIIWMSDGSHLYPVIAHVAAQ